MAIITIAAVKLVRMTDGHDWRLWIISGLIFALTAITGSEPILVIIGAGLFDDPCSTPSPPCGGDSHATSLNPTATNSPSRNRRSP